MATASIGNKYKLAIGPRLPRDSGPHRIACFALYRAVLKQCLRVPLPDDVQSRGPINPLKHLVRKGFRRHLRLTSPALIKSAFMVGYNAEALLRTAGNGSVPATSQIHSILYTLERRRTVSASQPRPVRKPRARVWPYPGAPKFLVVRPLPKEQLTGRRRVPFITETNGFAFLRARKPQSPYLSRVLRDKVATQVKRFDRLDELGEKMDMARMEEEWEKDVVERVIDEGEAKGGDKHKKWLMEGEGRQWGLLDNRWAKELGAVRYLVWKNLGIDQERTKEHGERLVKVWEEEKRLAKLEKNEKRRAKTGRWPPEFKVMKIGTNSPTAEKPIIQYRESDVEVPIRIMEKGGDDIADK